LGEIAESLEYGLNAAATDFDGMNKYIRITDIDDDSREFRVNSLTSPDYDLSLAEDYKLQDGDILFARTGASVGKTYRYRGTDGLVYFAGFLIRARIKPTFDVEFAYQNTLTSKYDNFIRITSQRSGQPGVNAQEYSSFDVMLPTLPEQARTGAFFRTLDSTITLHKRKLDGLKAIKAAYLQQMFPQAGETVPRVRFAGFEGAWEVRKVRDALTESRIQGSNGLDARKLTVKLWGKGIVAKETVYEGSTNTNYFVRKAGQIMYGKLDFLNAAFGVVPDELDGYESTIDAPAFDIAPDADVKFLLETFLQECFYEFQGNLANGSRRAKRINQEDFLGMPLSLPAHPEQIAIGRFFHHLDELSAAQQIKLDKLKQLKAAYLQKMFV